MTVRGLTVGIIARDEETDLPGLLAQLGFAEAVVVVVSAESRDRTATLARAAGAAVHALPFTDFSAARNAVLDAAPTEWVLFLDADERLTPALTAAVAQFVAAPGAAAGALVHRQDVFLGRRLRHGDADGWFLRLGKRTAGRWVRPVHETWELPGETVRLDGILEHHSHKSVGEYLRKMEAYTDLEAATGEQAHWWQLVAYPAAKFVRVYLIQGGILDGWQGLVFAALNARYSFAKRWKLLRRRP